MSDTIQVVRVDGDVPHFRIDQPVDEGWIGTVASIIVEGLPGDYVIVPAGDVIELIEELGPPFVMRDYDEPANSRWVSKWMVKR